MNASTSMGDGQRAATKLGDLLASLEVSSDWPEIETTAQVLANELRIRGGPVDEHTALGRTVLPQTITSLLTASLKGSRTPEGEKSMAAFELLRVGANLCMDHNENRGHLLEAGYPQVTLSLLEGFSELLPERPVRDPLPLTIPQLKLIKTAIGAILNLSLSYEPVQARLISLEAPLTLLRLSTAIFPPGAWLASTVTAPNASVSEPWGLRKSISEWSWRAISTFKEKEGHLPLFGPDCLPSLVLPLLAFIPPFPPADGPLLNDPQSRHALCGCDVDVLEEACELIESLTMDVEDVRLAMARGMTFPEEQGGHSCLSVLLDFVEFGEIPPHWGDIPDKDALLWRRAVELCKTAIIKAIVETSGEDNNLEVLWDLSESSGGFVSRMLKWIQAGSRDPTVTSFDDLVICGALCLGNLVRRENNSIALVKPPISITSYLSPHLRPGSDIKVKHGVIGLLKHLSQVPTNRPALGESHVLEALRTCEIFAEKSDFTEIVQMPAINLAKHLCTNNVNNAIVCVLDADEGQPSSSCLAQILSLSRRSDAVSVKSEGARVLVNIIKSLCSSNGDVRASRRQLAIKAVTNIESATALAQLLGRSKRHVILLNESIMALLLLSLQQGGAVNVLDAVLAPLPREVGPPSRSNSISNSIAMSGQATDSASPVSSPPSALAMMVTILKNAEPSVKFPAELRANLCALFGELGRESLKAESGGREREVEALRVAAGELLDQTQKESDNLVLNAAARKALGSW